MTKRRPPPAPKASSQADFEALETRVRELETETQQLRVALEKADLQVEEQGRVAGGCQQKADKAGHLVSDLSQKLATANERASQAEKTVDHLKKARAEREAFEEEYETATEELQAANEELKLVNQDLEARRASLEQRIEERTTELEESEARMRAIVEAAHDAIIIADGAGIVKAVNPAAEAMFGYPRGEIVGQGIGLLMTPNDRAQHDKFVRRYLESGERRVVATSRLVMAQRRNGNVFPAELSLADATDGGERLFVGSFRDVSPSERQKSRASGRQAALAEMHSHSAMGGMSRALSHELAQPLSAIRCYIAAGRYMLGAGGKPEERIAAALADLEKAEHEIERIGQIIQSLRELFEIGRAERAVEDPNAIVQDALPLALIGAPRAAAVHSRLTPELPPVCVNRVQIEEVVVNLVRNALEAIGEREDGCITVATALADGGFVKVTVGDNGPGLASDVADRVFFPFVSTKTGGTGIGLLICRSIVEAYGGTIEASSGADGGAEFSFTLPVASARERRSVGEATA